MKTSLFETMHIRTSLLAVPFAFALLSIACDPKLWKSDEHSSDAHEKREAKGHDDDHRGPGVVHIEPEAVKRVGLRVAEAEGVPRAGGIEVPAEVRPEPDRLAHVSSVVAGQISKVHASVGDTVEAGQNLAFLRSVALGEARAQAARARANVEVADANFKRQEELKKEGIGAERNYLEAQAELRRAQAEQSAAARALEVYGRGGSGSEIAIKSPIAGRVVARHATVGEVAGPGEVLFEITDITKVWVVGRVYQQHASQVKEGAQTLLTLQSHPGRTFTGALDYVAPALEEKTRTLPVRMTLDNSDGVLRPGSFGTLSIAPGDAKDDLIAAVAVSALQRLGDETVVFVPTGKAGEYRAVPVVVLARSGGLARLSEGLLPGQEYVADGGFVLKSELSRGQLGEGHAH